VIQLHMNADQLQVVAEMLVQNLQYANESGTAVDVIRALNLINRFLGVEENDDDEENEEEEENKEEYNDEQKENELMVPLLDDDAMDIVDHDDMPPLVDDVAMIVDYDSDYDDMPPLIDVDDDYDYDDEHIEHIENVYEIVGDMYPLD